MELIVMAISNVVFFCIGTFLGKQYKGKKPKAMSPIDESELNRQKKLREDFQKMMDYNYAQALGGGKHE